VAIPEGVTTLPESAFEGCSSLTSVSLPSTIKTISERAFLNCSNLTSFTIPDSVETIEFPNQYARSPLYDGDAFKGCSKLSLAIQAALKRRGYTGSFQ